MIEEDTKLNKGIIYLLQPAELIGTNRYKIGFSGRTDLRRCKKGYLSNSKCLCVMYCNEPYKLERKIKDEFKKKFKLVAGKEYFEGNETEMFNEFTHLHKLHIESYKHKNDSSLIQNTTITTL